jgi:hypothetical protein
MVAQRGWEKAWHGVVGGCRGPSMMLGWTGRASEGAWVVQVKFGGWKTNSVGVGRGTRRDTTVGRNSQLKPSAELCS